MDEYFGMNIKFITRGGPVHGILRGLDEVNEIFLVQIGEEDFKMKVQDVLDMDPVDEDLDLQGIKVSSVMEDPKEIKNKVNEEKCTVDKEKCTVDEEVPREMRPKETEPTVYVKPRENEEELKVIVDPLIPTLEQHKNPTSTTPLSSITSISMSQYQTLLNLSFTRFGPTKEEFISTGALNLFKFLIKSYFSLDSVIDIILGENTLYNSIGLTLGRLLLTHNYNVRIVGSPRTLEIVNYFYLYRENKGISIMKIREDVEFVINTSEVKGIERDVPFVFTFGGYCHKVDNRVDNEDYEEGGKGIKIKAIEQGVDNNIDYNTNNEVKPITKLICFGASITELVKDLNEYFLIDVMISESVYKKIKLSRRGMKNVTRVRK